MKIFTALFITYLVLFKFTYAQVDTSYIYGQRFGDNNFDIRIYIDQNNYYYLEEGKTLSYRAVNGVPTDTYHPMAGFNTSQYTEGHLRRKNGATTSHFIMNYRLLFPKSYNEQYAEGYPLIIMIHGYGERGNCWDNSCYWDTPWWNPNYNNPPAPTSTSGAVAPLLNNDHNLLHGGKPHLDAVNRANGKLPDDPSLDPRAFPGFVLFPQNLNGWWRNQPHQSYDVIRMVRLMIKEYNIDPNRIYIHGLSDGGSGVYNIMRRAPWLFSAALPMSAVNDGGLAYYNQIPEIVTIPIWTFQGGIDTNPDPTRTKNYVRNFLNAGMTVRHTIYLNLGHGTWNDAYSEPDFFSWMLAKNKSNPHIMYGMDYICETSGTGVEMVFAKGFFAYQWEKDGQIISGASAHNYVANTPGTYRGRFSRVPNSGPGDWNRWSDPIVIERRAPAKPVITANYTTVFPNINNDNSVVLQSDKEQDLKYRWYKNGTQINFNYTNEDDTITFFTVTNSWSFGSADYTLKTIDGNCESEASDVVTVRYSTPETLTAPTGFAGTPTSSSSIILTWTDNAQSEKGFEVWRRKGTTGSFTFVTLTAPNAISHHDRGLEPNTPYHYKLRTVTQTGRSPYAPGNPAGTNLIVTTHADTEAPSPPQNLRVTKNTLSSITLAWDAAADNTGIKQYIVYYGGNSVSTSSNTTEYTITGLQQNMEYMITVKAQDHASLLSPPGNQVIGTTYVSGLYYKHSTGSWDALTQINWNVAEYMGKVNTFDLSPRTQQDFFNFKFDGYLNIEQAGIYQFRTTSDDGSMMFLNGFNAADLTQHRIIDNDGLHGNRAVASSELTLAQGTHGVVVLYFEKTGNQSLTVQYRKKNSSGTGWNPDWTTIPASMLSSGSYTPPTAPAAPTNLAATSNSMTQVKLSWQYNGPVADQFEVYRAESSNGTYAIVNRAGSKDYIDSNLVPGTTYYYKVNTVSMNGAISSSSNVAYATTGVDTQAPSAPAGLQVLGVSERDIVFTWDASTDNARVTGYQVFIDNVLHDSTDVPGYTATELSPGTTYAFRVKAHDHRGNTSAFSSTLTATTEGTSYQSAASASRVAGGEENSLQLKEPDVAVYPSPVLSDFTINTKELGDEPIHVTLTDMTGHRYYINTVIETSGDKRVSLSTPTHMRSGIYMLIITQGKHQVRKRIMVVK